MIQPKRVAVIGTLLGVYMPDSAKRQSLVAARRKNIEVFDFRKLGDQLVGLHVHEHSAGGHNFSYSGPRDGGTHPAHHQVLGIKLQTTREVIETIPLEVSFQAAGNRKGGLRSFALEP